MAREEEGWRKGKATEGEGWRREEAREEEKQQKRRTQQQQQQQRRLWPAQILAMFTSKTDVWESTYQFGP